MGNILGIDLGASYAKAVYIAEGTDQLSPVLNVDYDCLFRVSAARAQDNSLVTFTKREHRERAVEQGRVLIENVKPLRGDDKIAEEVEVAVLRELLERYREQSRNYNLDQLDRVVLTHPANHRPSAVETLKRIAVRAGLPGDRLDTIEEPVALGFFAALTNTNKITRLLVIDAGHYTTDLVLVSMLDATPVLESTLYLSVRLGNAELLHEIACSLWMKAQMTAGERIPDLGPFADKGPEDCDPVVQQLSVWVENNVILPAQLNMPWFGKSTPAYLDLSRLRFPSVPGQWFTKLTPIKYQYDAADAQQEPLSEEYPYHRPENANRIQSENYRAVLRRITNALGAAILGVLGEVDAGSDVRVAIGGGLSLVPEVRSAIERLSILYGIGPPVDLSYAYKGVVASTGQLLSVASGAAIAARRSNDRQDTLSDTLGALLYYDVEEALTILREQGQLPPDFDPGRDLVGLGLRALPDGGLLLPLHRIMVRRGARLPVEVELDDDLVPLADGGTINLTSSRDQPAGTATAEPFASMRSGVIARIRVPAAMGSRLRFGLAIPRNGVFQLRVTHRDGTAVVDDRVSLEVAPRCQAT